MSRTEPLSVRECIHQPVSIGITFWFSRCEDLYLPKSWHQSGLAQAML